MTQPDPDLIEWNRQNLLGLVSGLRGQPDVAQQLTSSLLGAIVDAAAGAGAGVHATSDVDGSPRSLHHTLGASARQAAPGDHRHRYAPQWNADDLGTTDTLTTTTTERIDPWVNEVPIVARAGHIYLLGYFGARVQSDAVPATVDVRIYRSANPGTLVTGFSPAAGTVLVAGHSVPVQSTGGGGTGFTLLQLLTCGPRTVPGAADNIPAGNYLLGAFFRRTVGAGNVLLSTALGGRRQLVWLDLGIDGTAV